MTKQSNNKTPLTIAAALATAALLNIIIAANLGQQSVAMAEIRYAGEQSINTLGGTIGKSDIAMDRNSNSAIVWAREDSNQNSDIFLRRYNNLGKSIGQQETLVNTTSAGNQQDPSIAMDQDGNFIIAWAGKGSQDDAGIYMRVYKNDGTPIGDEILVNDFTDGIQSEPSVAIDYDGGLPTTDGKVRAVVSWSSEDPEYDKEVYYQLYDLDFTSKDRPAEKINTAQHVNTYRAGPQQHPSVAMNTFGEFVVAWDGTGLFKEQELNYQIWLQAYENDATTNTPSTLQGSYVRINTGNVPWTISPRVVADKSDNPANGGNYVVVYAGGINESNLDIYARRIGRQNESGCSLNALEISVNTGRAGNQQSPAVATDYMGDFTIIWSDLNRGNGDIYGQNYKFTGAPNGIEYKANSDSNDTGALSNPAIAMTADGFYNIIHNNENTNLIILQQFVSSLFKQGNERLVNDPVNSARVQSDGHVAMGPHNLVAGTYLEDGNKVKFFLYNIMTGRIKRDVLVASSLSSMDRPSISFFEDSTGDNVGRFIIAFSANDPSCRNPATSYSGSDIWYMEYDERGNPVPDNFCHRANITLYGEQTQPDIAAGYYNQDGGAIEDNFALIFREDNASGAAIKSIFHYDSKFSDEKTLETCTDKSGCKHPSVTINPNSNEAFFTYNKDPYTVWGETAVFSGNSLNSVSSAALSSTPTVLNDNPRSTMLPNNQVLVSYSKYNTNGTPEPTAAVIINKRFSFNDLETPLDTSTIGTPDQSYYTLSDVSADPSTGDLITVWTEFSPDSSSNYIWGQFYSYLGASTGGLKKYGPAFRINSTQTGNRLQPIVSMNNAGDVAIGWEGYYEEYKGQPGRPENDDWGAVGQFLSNPLYAGALVSYEPLCSQQIESGGRFIEVPDSITFPPATIKATEPSSVIVSVRENKLGDPDPIQYLQVTDLQGDGTPYEINVAATNLYHSDLMHFMPVRQLAVRNCDAATRDDSTCIQTIEGTAGDFLLSTDTFSPLTSDGFVSFSEENDPLRLAEGTGNSIGRWRFFPAFKLTIPPIPPVIIPGIYTSTITFTLL